MTTNQSFLVVVLLLWNLYCCRCLEVGDQVPQPRSILLGHCNSSIVVTYKHPAPVRYEVHIDDDEHDYHYYVDGSYSRYHSGAMETSVFGHYQTWISSHTNCFSPTAAPTVSPVPAKASTGAATTAPTAYTMEPRAPLPKAHSPRTVCSSQDSIESGSGVWIKPGETCQILDGTMVGPVYVEENATLEMDQVVVTSPVLCYGCKSVSIRHSQYIYGVHMEKPVGGGLWMENCTVSQTVEVSQASKRFRVRLSDVRGVANGGADVFVHESELDFVRIESESVLGSVVVVRNDVSQKTLIVGSPLGKLVIRSDVQIRENVGDFELRNVRVLGDLRAALNNGYVAFADVEFAKYDVKISSVRVEVNGSLAIPNESNRPDRGAPEPRAANDAEGNGLPEESHGQEPSVVDGNTTSTGVILFYTYLVAVVCLGMILAVLTMVVLAARRNPKSGYSTLQGPGSRGREKQKGLAKCPGRYQSCGEKQQLV